MRGVSMFVWGVAFVASGFYLGAGAVVAMGVVLLIAAAVGEQYDG